MQEFEEIMKKILEHLRSKQYQPLRELLGEMNPADIAEIMEALLDDGEIRDFELTLLYRLLPKDLAADVFVELNSDMQETLISALSDKELRAVLDDMYLDDTVDIIEEMPANVVSRILKNVDSATRKNINQILRVTPTVAWNLGKLTVAAEYDFTTVQYGNMTRINSHALAYVNPHWILNHRVMGVVRFDF